MSNECDHITEFEERDREFDEMSEAAGKLQDQVDVLEAERDKFKDALEAVFTSVNGVL